MKRCAYITMDDLSNFVSDAELSVDAMTSLGWEVTFVSWRADVDWNEFELAYLCTPWDYFEHVNAFLKVIDRIDGSRCVLVNPAEIVHWNADKRYLRDFARRGVPIVPSLWFDTFDAGAVTAAFGHFDADKLVLKPAVGAGAIDTFVIDANTDLDPIAESYEARPHIVQPFLERIVSAGEYAVCFFGGEYSHAIVKVPKPGDFRVQEEYGSDIRAIDPPDDMLSAASALLASISPEPVYARVDYVDAPEGGYWLMELELIEPSLYFRKVPGSETRFAQALDDYFARQSA